MRRIRRLNGALSVLKMKDLGVNAGRNFPTSPVENSPPVLDLARGIDSRLSSNAYGGRNPAWSNPMANGAPIAPSVSAAPGSTLKMPPTVRPNGRILQTRTINYLDDWSRDGRFLIYTGVSLKTGFRSLWAIPDPLGSGEPKPIALGDPREQQAATSPDSRWLAYISNESTPPSSLFAHSFRFHCEV